MQLVEKNIFRCHELFSLRKVYSLLLWNTVENIHNQQLEAYSNSKAF